MVGNNDSEIGDMFGNYFGVALYQWQFVKVYCHINYEMMIYLAVASTIVAAGRKYTQKYNKVFTSQSVGIVLLFGKLCYNHASLRTLPPQKYGDSSYTGEKVSVMFLMLFQIKFACFLEPK